MSGQGNITALSDPAGAVNDAAILGSTTAAPTLVFKPGVTFSNHGPIRQNTYTSPNASGVDGLVLLQSTLQGQGFFPTLPLPSSQVEFDFSANSDAFALTANLNLGANCTVKGLVNQSNDAIPTLNTSTFTIVPFLELKDLNLTAQATSGQTFTATPGGITFSGRTTVTTPNGFPLYTLSSGISTVTLRDTAILGDSANQVIAVSGGTLTIDLFDGSSLTAAAINRTGGSVVINSYSPGATIDPSYNSIVGVTVNLYTTGGGINQTITFQPGGTAAGTVYTTEASIQAYIASIGDQVAAWTIQFDFVGDTYAAAGNLDFGPNATLQGVFDQTNEVFPTFRTAFTLAPPVEIRDINLFTSNASQTFTTEPAFLRISGEAFIAGNNVGGFLYTVSNTDILELHDTTSVGNGFPVIQMQGGELTIFMFDQTTLIGSAIDNTTNPGDVQIIAVSSATIDSSYLSMSGVSVTILGSESDNTGLLFYPGSFASWADLVLAANALSNPVICFAPGSWTVPSGNWDLGSGYAFSGIGATTGPALTLNPTSLVFEDGAKLVEWPQWVNGVNLVSHSFSPVFNSSTTAPFIVLINCTMTGSSVADVPFYQSTEVIVLQTMLIDAALLPSVGPAIVGSTDDTTQLFVISYGNSRIDENAVVAYQLFVRVFSGYIAAQPQSGLLTPPIFGYLGANTNYTAFDLTSSLSPGLRRRRRRRHPIYGDRQPWGPLPAHGDLGPGPLEIPPRFYGRGHERGDVALVYLDEWADPHVPSAVHFGRLRTLVRRE